MSPSPWQAVLTGDVIGSSRLQADVRTHLAERLHDAFERVREIRSLHSDIAFDVFRGDSWQLFVEHPAESLRVAITYRAWVQTLASVDCRMALAIDTTDFVNRQRVSESDGAAFRRSGSALDHLGRRSMACLLPEAWASSTRQVLFSTIASAIGAFCERWTPAQAQAVALTLSLPARPGDYATQEHVAAAWEPEPVTQQAVSAHLRKAYWDVIAEYLTTFSSQVDRMVEASNHTQRKEGRASDE